MNTLRAMKLARRYVSASIGVAVASASLLTPSLASAAPAPYSSLGPGYAQIVDGKLAPLGAYIPDGDRSVLVYCGELGKEGPWSDTNRAGDIAWSGVSADDNARVNAVVSTFGQQRDNNMTAAVQAFVWEKVDHQHYVEHGGSDGLIRDRVPASQQQAVKKDLTTIRAAAAKVTAASAKPSGTLTVTLDKAHPDQGTVTVAGVPAGTTGTLTLAGGVFGDTNTATMSGARAGNTYSVKNLSAADGETDVKASVAGSFVIAPPKGWDDLFQGTVGEWTAGEGQQHTVGPSKKGPKEFTLTANATASTMFSPVVSSKVADDTVTVGEVFQDTWTFDTAEGSLPWRQLSDGTYLPVKATGTLYGPLTTKPSLSDEAPEDAPVAGTAEITTDAKSGPAGPYTVTAVDTAGKPLQASKMDATGYYTWQIRIEAADQTDRTAANLPTDYRFVDQYGQPNETHTAPAIPVIPAKPDVPAKPVVPVVGVAAHTGGSITPTHDTAWIGWGLLAAAALIVTAIPALRVTSRRRTATAERAAVGASSETGSGPSAP